MKCAEMQLGVVNPADRRNICERVSLSRKISLAMANHLFDQLRLFLSASVFYENSDFSPPEEMDWIWHEFILHTHAYIDFCRSVGVGYIHHIPFGASADGKKQHEGNDLCSALKSDGIAFDTTIWEKDELDSSKGCSKCGCDKSIVPLDTFTATISGLN